MLGQPKPPISRIGYVKVVKKCVMQTHPETGARLLYTSEYGS